jgi:DNA-directed RNA polymerase specialized sigma24 family protein
VTRLDDLVAEFGADPRSTDPLPKLAREVYHEFTRSGGRNGYATHGNDVVSPEEILQKVYETWLNAEHVTVEWFETRDKPGAMLRSFCQQAAQNIINQNLGNDVARRGVVVTPTAMVGGGDIPEEARKSFIAPGAETTDSLEWLVNSDQFTSDTDNPEAEYAEGALLETLETHVAEIIETLPTGSTAQQLTAMYYLDGMEIEEAAEVVGYRLEAGKKALQRARKSVGEQDAAALVAWRRAMYPSSGRQPRSSQVVPEAFAKALT